MMFREEEMDAKTAVKILQDYGSDNSIDIADYIDQQENKIEAMKNCTNCHYQEYTELDLPCNNCNRCYEGNEEDCWELRAELLKVYS
jgi:hypothetical protein